MRIMYTHVFNRPPPLACKYYSHLMNAIHYPTFILLSLLIHINASQLLKNYIT
jgi:hypothetical protein